MLLSAPPFTAHPGFTDAQHYKFTMFKRNVVELKEEKVCSPLAIAVNTGSPLMVEALFGGLHGIEVDFGLEVTGKHPVQLHSQTNVYSKIRRRTPLQYACSLGLFQIVARLLKEGANPNILPLKERKPHIDYGELPLDIVLNPKHHSKDLSLEGLTFASKYNPDTEQDYTICLKLLLEYGAKAGLDPAPRLRETKKRPTPVF